MIQAVVARHKLHHPEAYCPERRCLWHTGGGLCPRHGGRQKEGVVREERLREIQQYSMKSGREAAGQARFRPILAALVGACVVFWAVFIYGVVEIVR